MSEEQLIHQAIFLIGVYLLLNLFEVILKNFEKSLKGYSYKSISITNREKVFILEDSLILYIGLLTHCENWFGYTNEEKDKRNAYNLRIEELTHNTIGFKFNLNKFVEYVNIELANTIICSYLNFFRCDIQTIDYKVGDIVNNCHTGKTITQPRMIDRIDKLVPTLKIKERNESWQGVLYYFIVLEVIDANNNKGLGVFRTTTKPYSYIINKGKNWIKKGFYCGNMDAVGNGFEKALMSYRGKKIKRKDILENKLTYFVIEKYVKDKNKLWNIATEILEKAENKLYDSIERSTYIKPIHKWKTEELVYKYIKKLYKGYNIIYQHRPFFLKGKTGGQMSYDIFIADLNIAIEYQGKQHFEPIDFFGGKEGFKKTVIRDELKRMLSIQNGVKLIYIYYWENISLELLKQKINN